MNKNLIITILVIAILGLAAWLAFGYFGVQYSFTDNEVDEEIPTATTTTDSEEENEGTIETNDEEAEDTETDTDPVQNTVMQKLTGAFGKGDSTYDIAGEAILFEQNGAGTLSFSDFSVTNGPDLYVYAIKTTDTSNAGVKAAVERGDYVELATLKGNVGNQNYDVDPDTIEEYNVVSVWCKRFARNFGHAVLQ